MLEALQPHLLVLVIVTPMLAAPLCALLPNNRAPWLWSTLVATAVLVMAASLLGQVLDGSTISYQMGGWAPPWGIEYALDAVNGFVAFIIALIGAMVLVFAGPGLAKEVPVDKHAMFYTAYLLCLCGLLGLVVTGDAFNVFVFLEISSLATYTLIGLGKDRKALTSAFQYLIMGTIGATFILIGIGLMYMMTGTLNMADLAARLPAVAHTSTVEMAFAFFIVGVSLKLALFPLHLWLPNAYTYAPSAVTAFLASTATKAAVYVMLRFVFDIFGADFAFGQLPLTMIFATLAIVGIFSGSAVAMFQPNAKRILAYSSVAQIGYMILAIGLDTVLGLTAGIVHLFNHALIKGALFLALGCVVYRIGSTRLEHMAGIGRKMPWTMGAFAIGGLALIGVPLTTGFITKWHLILAALDKGWWPVAVLVVIASLMAVYYVWRIVEVAYFHQASEKTAAATEAPLALLIPTWALALGNLYFGVDTRLPLGAARLAAELLMAPLP